MSKPVTKYASIAQWASAVGSKAKTPAGQRKAIMAAFGPRIVGIRYDIVTKPYSWDRNAAGKAQYFSLRQVNKDFRLGVWASANRDLAAKHQPEALAQVIAVELARQVEREKAHLCRPVILLHQEQVAPYRCTNGSRQVSPLVLQDTKSFREFSEVGGWTITLQEDVSYDNHKYSKSYHAKYGDAKSVDGRTVRIRRVAEDGTLENRDVDVSAWRGNFLLNALIESGIIEANKGQANIRLHPAYGLNMVRNGRILKIYERTLAGEHVDYCAVVGGSSGITFHAATVREAIVGLREKIRVSTLKAKGKLITMELGRSLGFCETGMKEFASAFDLDIKGHYTPDQLAAIVARNLPAARPFAAELRTLANAVGYAIPAELG